MQHVELILSALIDELPVEITQSVRKSALKYIVLLVGAAVGKYHI